ncbi:MAG TPA: hypothetical protein VMW89_12920 [Desulfatiglandales bacterium]|nr:hypothetical protein [Desulfatiglandales bacterium]
MSKFIYVDVCALSRPFDDQSFMRIRLETEAVNLILSKIKEGRFKLLVSTAHTIWKLALSMMQLSGLSCKQFSVR